VKSSTVLLSAIALVAALGLAAPAMARTDRIHVDIKTLPNSDGKARYSGDIDSDISSCVSGRTVKVYAKQSRLVKTRSDSEGKFSAIGKAAAKGDKLTVKVRPKGDCPKLVGTGEAE
jgi:hypothetical protein